MNNIGKNWDDNEEDKLIIELNKQNNLKDICDKHQRESGGIRARIKKILDDPNKSNRLTDKTQTILKYFSNDHNQMSKEEYITVLKTIKSNILNYNNIKQIIDSNNINDKLAKNILEKILSKEPDFKTKNHINKLIKDKLNPSIESKNNSNYSNSNNNINLSSNKLIINYINDFDSVFTIKKVFDKLEIDDILGILKEYIKSENPLKEKKDRIKFIIKRYREVKEEDDYDKEFDANKVRNKIFGYNTGSEEKKIYTKDNIFDTNTTIINNNLLEQLINMINIVNNNIKDLNLNIIEIKNNIKELDLKINYLEQNNYLKSKDYLLNDINKSKTLKKHKKYKKNIKTEYCDEIGYESDIKSDDELEKELERCTTL